MQKLKYVKFSFTDRQLFNSAGLIVLFFLVSQEALAPRAARNIKSYAETNPLVETNKRKKRGTEAQERFPKRRKADSGYSAPAIEGAAAQVRGWSYGNLSKRDATRFSRVVWPNFYAFSWTSMFCWFNLLFVC